MNSVAPTLKRLILEPDGNDAGIMLADCDPKAVAAEVFKAAFTNNGQILRGAQASVVPCSLYEAVCAELAAIAHRTVVGPGLEQGSEREILASAAMRPYFEAGMAPGAAVASDEHRLDIAYRTGPTVFHPVGTSRMGPVSDPQCVVDDTLRVHGLERLRRIDASIMPNLTSAKTAAAAMVIGEKRARLVLPAQAASNAARCDPVVSA